VFPKNLNFHPADCLSYPEKAVGLACVHDWANGIN